MPLQGATLLADTPPAGDGERVCGGGDHGSNGKTGNERVRVREETAPTSMEAPSRCFWLRKRI